MSNSLGVQSYVELFNTMIGWDQYNHFWSLITDTGMITIPFICIIVMNTVSALKSDSGIRAIATTAVNKTMLEVLGACIVITLAGTPVIALNAKVLSYTPLCGAGRAVHIGNTDTTFETAYTGNIPQQTHVPLLWYAAMAIGEGSTRALKQMIPCYKDNYRTLRTEVNTDKIQDAALKRDVESFVNICYASALKKFMETNQTAGDPQAQHDINTLGSRYFISTPGYYDKMISPDELTDIPKEPGLQQQTCKAWWITPRYGLRSRLEKEVSPGFLDYAKTLGNKEKAVNRAIDELVKNSMSSAGLAGGMSMLTDSLWAGKNYTSRFIGSNIGLNYEKLTFFPKMALIIQALPILQSYALMIIYMVIPIMLLIGYFKPKVISVTVFLIISIIMWSFWWQLAEVVDRAMINAFFPLSDLGFNAGTPQLLVDMVGSLMYFGMPLLATAVISLAGFPAAGAISLATGFITSHIGSAGDKAVSAATTAATLGRGLK